MSDQGGIGRQRLQWISMIDDVTTVGFFSNLEKHNVSFEEAKDVFDDPLQISLLDHHRADTGPSSSDCRQPVF